MIHIVLQPVFQPLLLQTSSRREGELLEKIIFLMICLSCLSCQSQSQLSDGDLDLKECGKIEINESEFLMMQIVPEKVSSNSTNRYIIENHTTHDMHWGPDYSLEYYDKNKWKVVPFDGLWSSIGYILYAGEVYDSETIAAGVTLFTLVEKYNRGKKGRYRIIRKVTFVDIGDIGKYKLCAEFEII